MSIKGTYAPEALNAPETFTAENIDTAAQPRVFIDNMEAGDILRVSVKTDDNVVNQVQDFAKDDIDAGDNTIEFMWYGVGDTISLTLEQVGGTVKTYKYEINFKAL